MKKLLFALLTLAPCLAFAQLNEKGLILPPDDNLYYSEEYCCVLSPSEGFTVYDSPKGKKIGTIKKLLTSDDQSAYKIYFIANGNRELVEEPYTQEVAYEIWALTYSKHVDGHVQVMDEKNSYWLSVGELKSQHFIAKPWMDYLIATSGNILGYYANEPGLRLRESPSPSAKVIGSVRGDLFEISLSSETSGCWCKVTVRKLKEHPCVTDLDEKENLEYIQEGWMKVLDDDGNPNLWQYVRGC